MNDERQMATGPSSPAATFLPPAAVGETAWDILLALRSDPRHEFRLVKLARLVSVPQWILTRWLELLEQRKLVAGSWDFSLSEPRAVLTIKGRELLDRYLAATDDLQVGAGH